MPPIVAAAIYGGSAIASAWAQSRSANKASQLAAKGNEDALAFEKERDKRDYDEYMREQEHQWALDEADRRQEQTRYSERQERLKPYREMGAQGMSAVSALLRPMSNPPNLRITPPPQGEPGVMPVMPVSQWAMRPPPR